jgi:excisionase family DNA binding protein
MITINNKTYYTTIEIAEKIGVHKRTIHNWLKSGKLIPYKFGTHKFYFDDEAIEKCIRGE